jgi:hypothetical protein
MEETEKLDCITLKGELALALHAKLRTMTAEERQAHWLEIEKRMLARQAAARTTLDLDNKPEERPDRVCH